MLLPAAAADVEEAYRWYEAQNEGLGDEFLSVFQAALDGLRAEPQAAPQVHRDVRRHLLKRFPHAVFYRVVDGKVVVLACFPAGRRLRVPRRRASGSRR
jgi:plasmid stabilization system protein ParE